MDLRSGAHRASTHPLLRIDLLTSSDGVQFEVQFVEVVLMAERRAHADRLGDMEGLDLDNGEVMAGAWR